jgi:hypothetical protein
VYYTKKTTRKWSISSFVGKILFLFVHKIENRRRVGEEDTPATAKQHKRHSSPETA